MHLPLYRNRLNAQSSISWIIHNLLVREDGLPPNLFTKVLIAKSNVQRVQILRGCANCSGWFAQIVLRDCVNYGRSRGEKLHPFAGAFL